MLTRIARVLRIGALVLGAVACAKRDMIAPADSTPVALNPTLDTRVLLVSSVSSPLWADDPLVIGGVSVDGDTLRVAATYGGGCRRHALQPIAEATWLESAPVQVHARIAHNAGGDACKALVTRVLNIDLSPLKERYRETYQTTTGRIAIRLAGAETVPVYSF